MNETKRLKLEPCAFSAHATRANVQVVAGSEDFKRCWFIHKIKSHHKILFSLRVDFHLAAVVG